MEVGKLPAALSVSFWGWAESRSLPFFSRIGLIRIGLILKALSLMYPVSVDVARPVHGDSYGGIERVARSIPRLVDDLGDDLGGCRLRRPEPEDDTQHDKPGSHDSYASGSACHGE
jgi:hypothetical protein